MSNRRKLRRNTMRKVVGNGNMSKAWLIRQINDATMFRDFAAKKLKEDPENESLKKSLSLLESKIAELNKRKDW